MIEISVDFLVFVGDLPRGRGEEQEREDEERLREILQRVRRHRREARGLVRKHDHERVLEYVVVERAEELTQKKGPNRRYLSSEN